MQLLKEVKAAIAITKSHPQRANYEYERGGVANMFMRAATLDGRRKCQSDRPRPKIDWILEMTALLEDQDAQFDRVVVVCDNLNTHIKGAFHEAFKPEYAFGSASQLEFHYAPNHASWLNIVENKLSSVTCQCIRNRHIGDVETLQAQTTPWASDVSVQQHAVYC